MKKLLAAALLLLGLCSEAAAQNPQCPTRPPGDSTNACASTAFVQQAVGGGGGGGGSVIDVTQFGVVCDATGSVDNRAAFKAIATFVNANNTAIINFPHGHLNCGVWPAGTPIVAQDSLFNIADAIGLTVNYNGACITTNAPNADWPANNQTYVWLFTNSYRVTLNNPCYLQSATVNPDPTIGATHIVIGGGSGYFINNGRNVGGRIGVAVSRASADPTTKADGVFIDGFAFDGTFYPMNLSKGGDNFTAVNITSQNHGRFYYPYNVKSQFVRGKIKASGHIQPEGALLRVSCDDAESASFNSLEAVDVGIDIEGDPLPTDAAIVDFTFGQDKAGDGCLNKGAMRNIKVSVTGSVPATPNGPTIFYTNKFAFSGAIDTTPRGYTLDNIEINGALIGTNPALGVFIFANLFNPANGSFSGENISNIILDKITLRTATSTPGSNNIQIDGTSVNGLRLNSIRVPDNVILSNVTLAQTAWNQIYATSFTINGSAAPPKAFPECADTGGNHINYTSAAGITCGNSGGGGGGGVTSVAQTFTGGLISVAGSPITSTGTLALSVAGTSGGIPYFSGAATWASSGVLGAGLPVVGGGAGLAPSSGTRSGNTTQFVTTTGTQTSGNCVTIDASGNHIAAGAACGTSSGGITSITATAPVIATPSPIVATGTLSCPTCVTSAAALTTGNLVIGQGGQASASLAPGQLPATTANDDAAAGKVGEFVAANCGFLSSAITVTIATPAVVTWTGHPYSNTRGRADSCPVVFTTTGALPTGITAGTGYYIIPSSITANTFRIATTVDNAIAGTAVNTSGTQSGTHTGTGGLPITSGALQNVTAISLTAGDWDVSGVIMNNSAGGTVTSLTMGFINSFGAGAGQSNPPNLGGFYQLWGDTTAAAVISLPVGIQRVVTGGTLTMYLISRYDFTTSSMTGYGYIGARRVR